MDQWWEFVHQKAGIPGMQETGSSSSWENETILVVSKICRTLRIYWKERLKEAFYEGLKKVFGPEENGTSPVLSSDSETLFTDKEEILSRWKEHFEKCLKFPVCHWWRSHCLHPSTTGIPQLSDEPCLKEVQVAIKQISSDKGWYSTWNLQVWRKQAGSGDSWAIQSHLECWSGDNGD